MGRARGDRDSLPVWGVPPRTLCLLSRWISDTDFLLTFQNFTPFLSLLSRQAESAPSATPLPFLPVWEGSHRSSVPSSMFR